MRRTGEIYSNYETIYTYLYAFIKDNRLILKYKRYDEILYCDISSTYYVSIKELKRARKEINYLIRKGMVS